MYMAIKHLFYERLWLLNSVVPFIRVSHVFCSLFASTFYYISRVDLGYLCTVVQSDRTKEPAKLFLWTMEVIKRALLNDHTTEE